MNFFARLTAIAALFWCTGGVAQDAQIYPNPANAWQAIGLSAVLDGGDGCNNVAIVRSVTREGSLVLVDYEIVPRQGLFGCLTPPALRLHAPLGSFDPGTYTLRWSAGSALPGEAQFVVTAPPAKEAYARLELVAGDRQVIRGKVTDFVRGEPLAPLRVRALDEAGRPIVGLQLAMVPALGIGVVPVQVDAFGYTGFNTDRTLHLPSWSSIIGGPPFLPSDLAITDANGVATVEPNPNYSYAPGALLFGVYPWPNPGSAKPRFFSFVVTQAKPAGTPRVVVEFVHEPSGNYFITQDDAEIARLDAGVVLGWKRSVGSFIAFADGGNDASTVPVCRLFSERFTSHFFSASAAECDEVLRRWPDTWTLETRSAFRVPIPDPSGACPAGTQPVYRLLKGNAAVNHRYVTDRALRDVMVTRGWIAEGAGADAVAMCSPA